MNKLFEYLLWLIFPKRCAACNKLIKRDEHLCFECREKIERIDKICTVCGFDKKSCVCKWRVFHFRGATAAFNHGECSKEVVNNYKFRGNSEIANFLAPEMLAAVKKNFPEISFDYVASVPMYPIKKFIRGFNHSEMLAKKLSKELGVPYFKNLRKTRNNKPQHKSSFKERRDNVKNLFKSETIKAKNVLLVDDIKTSGATLDECSRELMFSGAENVYCVTAIANNFKKTTVEKS